MWVFSLKLGPCKVCLLRGCPTNNWPRNLDQNFDFLQNFSTKQGWSAIKKTQFFSFYSG